ncbi:hypothetical protein JHK85_038242 [Glycine max]|nr:hypothetical protein JHK85_038242 [Glycine max]
MNMIVCKCAAFCGFGAISIQFGKIKKDENGDIADDHYHRYLEDIELMSSLGVNVYRFSISWARILPRGIYGDINPSGIMFYNKIIDNLLLRGIEPFVTIHHYDLPQELEERYGGWISPLIQSDFVHFAEICFKSFGDRVKYWTTINEPNLFADFGYMEGTYAPGHCSPPFGNCNTGNSDVEPLIVMHNMLLSHAKAVELYRKHFQAKQGGTIGIVAFSFMYDPLRDEECDRQAVSRGLAFDIACKMPVFSPVEKSLIKGSLDFIGINHYGTLYAKDCSLSTCSLGADHPIAGFLERTATRDGIPIGDPTGVPDFFVVPRGMEKLVEYIKIRYRNMPMYITENGYSQPPKPDVTIHDLLQDFKRIDYHKAYLAALLRSIRWNQQMSIPRRVPLRNKHFLLPGGIYGDINPNGIMFYNKIIDNLLLKGIEPFVTIHHQDLPQELEERYGGWISPLMHCYTGNSDVEPLIVVHNMLLAQAKAVELYRKHFQAKQGGTIGIVSHSLMVLDPLVYGEYLAEMRSILGSQLPVFSPKEKNLIKGSIDFVGMSHYGSLYAKDCSLSACSLGADHPITGLSWFFVVPRGIEKLADYIRIRYHNIPMYITENGA